MQGLARLRAPRCVRRATSSHRRRRGHAAPDPPRSSSVTRSGCRSTSGVRSGAPDAVRRRPAIAERGCPALEDACAPERLQMLRCARRSRRPVRARPGQRARPLPAHPPSGAERSGGRPRARNRRAHRIRRRLDASRAPPTATCTWPRAASAPSRTRRSPRADQLAAFYPDLLDPDVEARSSSSISATRRTRARHGSGRSRSGCSAITARSTRSPATRPDACARGRLRLRRRASRSAASARDRRRRIGLRDPRRDRRAPREAGRRPAAAGRDIRHAIAMRVPAPGRTPRPWTRTPRAFYRWHASLMEPWDGPAALSSPTASPSARRSIATACGPCATAATDDGLVVCASEAGVVDLARSVVRPRRLGPGQMLVVDPAAGGLQTRSARGDRAPRRLGGAHRIDD